MPEPRSAEEWAKAIEVAINNYHSMSFADPPSYHTQLDECEMCQEKRQELVANALAAYAAQQTAAHVEQVMKSERTIQAALILQRDALRAEVERLETERLGLEGAYTMAAHENGELREQMGRLTKELTEPFDAEHIISAVAVAVGSGSARRVRHYVESTKADRDALVAVAKALRGVLGLVEAGHLVRNITNDAHFPTYLAESARLVQVLKDATEALAHPVIQRAVKE